MQVRLKLEYDGTNYSGWQLQAGQDSIQARVEAALERIFGAHVRVHGAGRTDAGVHARGQVAVDLGAAAVRSGRTARALNALLPPTSWCSKRRSAADDFRSAARRAPARVRISHAEPPIASAFEYRYSWLVREPLDLAAMNEAARRFVGEHDFAAFRSLGTEVTTTVRRVISRGERSEARDARLCSIASRRAAFCGTWCARWWRRWSMWDAASSAAADISRRCSQPRSRARACVGAARRAVPGRSPLLNAGSP